MVQYPVADLTLPRVLSGLADLCLVVVADLSLQAPAEYSLDNVGGSHDCLIDGLGPR